MNLFLFRDCSKLIFFSMMLINSRKNELEEICRDPDMLIGRIEKLESVSINFLEFF